MTDSFDLDRLVELAEAASKTDGEWDEFAFTDFAFEEDRAFVLAVSPSTVLALVRELREAREGLDAAWREAEAAAPATGVLALRHHAGDYRATWYRPVDEIGGGTVIAESGPTPAAALRALTGALRDKP